MKIKLLSTEATLTTANTVSDARVVRVLNNNAGLALITRRNSSETTLGTITMQANTALFFEKESADTLSSNVSVLATSVAFTH